MFMSSRRKKRERVKVDNHAGVTGLAILPPFDLF